MPGPAEFPSPGAGAGGPLAAANLALAFLLELVMLGALVDFGLHLPASTAARVIVAAGVPVLVIVVWGRFAAPRARTRLPQPWLGLFKLALFALAALGLYVSGHVTLGAAFGAVSLVHLALARYFGQ
jgi:hypothetical protein